MTKWEKIDKLLTMKKGTMIIYTPNFGDGISQEARFYRIRNERQDYIIDVELLDGGVRWGYIDQITTF